MAVHGLEQVKMGVTMPYKRADVGNGYTVVARSVTLKPRNNMLVKYPNSPSHSVKGFKPLYFLAGPDYFLLAQAASEIRQAWENQCESEYVVLTINAPADWDDVLLQAKSYSLFSERTLLDVRFEKQTLDKTSQSKLLLYLENPNTDCLVLIRAPLLPVKQLMQFSQADKATVLQITSLSPLQMQQWVKSQLQQKGIAFTPDVPNLMQQMTEGNMLACAQAIEKLALSIDAGETVTHDRLMAEITDQSNLQPFELTEALLAGNLERAIRLIRFAATHQGEPTLTLWIIAQEVRQLVNLHHAIKSGNSLKTACSQLKIWQSRVRLYQQALSRLSVPRLYALLQSCQALDEHIKSSQNGLVWQELEQLVCQLCYTALQVS